MDIYLLDPTFNDDQSKVRGIGRYVSSIIESLPNIKRIANVKNIPFDSILLIPFFDITKKPIFYKRYAKIQLAVIHDIIPLKYPLHYPLGKKATLYKIFNIWYLKNYIDHVITDSEVSKLDIVKILKIPFTKITKIYPPIADVFFDQKNSIVYTIPQEYVVYVGDATWNKNIVNILLATEKSKIHCIFVGKVFEQVKKYLSGDESVLDDLKNPWQNELLTFIKQAKTAKYAIFAGFITDGELIYIYKNALCNILLSRDEGFGYSFGEASLNLCPSLLSDKPIFHETSNDYAFFTKEESISLITEELLQIKNKSVLSVKIAKLAHNYCKKYSKDMFSQEFNKLISNIDFK